MAAQDYDNFERIFSGTWKFDRNENMDAFLDAMEAAEADRARVAGSSPVLTYSRAGDRIHVVTEVVPGVKFESSFQLGEVVEVKDKPENPEVHFNITSVMNGEELHQDVEPIKAGKRHVNVITVNGDQMTYTVSCGGVSGKRIFKRI